MPLVIIGRGRLPYIAVRGERPKYVLSQQEAPPTFGWPIVSLRTPDIESNNTILPRYCVHHSSLKGNHQTPGSSSTDKWPGFDGTRNSANGPHKASVGGRSGIVVAGAPGMEGICPFWDWLGMHLLLFSEAGQ